MKHELLCDIWETVTEPGYRDLALVMHLVPFISTTTSTLSSSSLCLEVASLTVATLHHSRYTMVSLFCACSSLQLHSIAA